MYKVYFLEFRNVCFSDNSMVYTGFALFFSFSLFSSSFFISTRNTFQFLYFSFFLFLSSTVQVQFIRNSNFSVTVRDRFQSFIQLKQRNKLLSSYIRWMFIRCTSKLPLPHLSLSFHYNSNKRQLMHSHIRIFFFLLFPVLWALLFIKLRNAIQFAVNSEAESHIHSVLVNILCTGTLVLSRF